MCSPWACRSTGSQSCSLTRCAHTRFIRSLDFSSPDGRGLWCVLPSCQSLIPRASFLAAFPVAPHPGTTVLGLQSAPPCPVYDPLYAFIAELGMQCLTDSETFWDTCFAQEGLCPDIRFLSCHSAHLPSSILLYAYVICGNRVIA
jgi:hypothetical protein